MFIVSKKKKNLFFVFRVNFLRFLSDSLILVKLEFDVFLVIIFLMIFIFLKCNLIVLF